MPATLFEVVNVPDHGYYLIGYTVTPMFGDRISFVYGKFDDEASALRSLARQKCSEFDENCYARHKPFDVTPFLRNPQGQTIVPAFF